MNDLKFAFRQLLKNPGFTVVAVLTLALGIGVNTSIFSIANAIMLRPLPVENPGELSWLSWHGKLSRFSGKGWGHGDESGITFNSVPYPMFRAFQQQAEGTEVFGLHRINGMTVRARQQALNADGFLVSGNFMNGLGIQATLGRTFGQVDGLEESASEVVLSHRLWQRAFGGDPDVLGKPLTIKGHVFLVTGVLPAGFRGPVRGYEGEFYLPFLAQPLIQNDSWLGKPGFWWVEVICRLKGDASEALTLSSLQVIMTRTMDETHLEDRSQPLKITLHDATSGMQISSVPLGAPLRPLQGAVGIVLLIACANLAGLLLVNAVGREHQLAIEKALGASRWRLIRRLMMQSLLIALVGAALGFGLATWGKTLLVNLLWPGGLPVDLSGDRTVLLFTCLIAVSTAMLIGLLPAWRLSKINLCDSLRSKSSVGLPRLGLGRTLVSAQVALSLVLLIGGALFTRSLYRISQVNPGFDTGRLLALPVNASGAGYQGLRRIAYYEQARTSLESLPGVSGVTLASKLLISDSIKSMMTRRPDSVDGDDDRVQTLYLYVGETFLKTMGVALLQGREFLTSDSDTTEKVVIIGNRLAREVFPNDDGIGRHLKIGGHEYRVVGVCQDFKYASLRNEPSIALFPYRQQPDLDEGMVLYAHTDGSPVSLLPTVLRTLERLDSNVAIPQPRTMSMQIKAHTGEERASAYAGVGLAGLAVLLSCIGLYGLMSYHVTRRSAEMGVRLALGATGRGLLVSVLREAAWMAVTGILAGLVLASILAPLIRNRLFHVDPLDWKTFTVAAALLLAATLLGAMIPARRAASIDPMEALRN